MLFMYVVYVNRKPSKQVLFGFTIRYVCAVKFHVHWEVELTYMHTQVMYLSPVQYTTGGVHLPYMVSVNKCDISH